MLSSSRDYYACIRMTMVGTPLSYMAEVRMRSLMVVVTVAAFSSDTKTSKGKRARDRTLISFTKLAIIIPHLL
jgi:hypothetical protein